ncbi:phage tail protein [Acinetobacter bereziniae]|uniref:phage tail protein n=1 Tax=Acinetobacter bereziniae TaxID=106648 RepID=UPI001D0E3D14|nr:phage tail protein [Acinetobacter bereziniae]
MGGSKSQTVGYTYFKGLMAVIGNRIEHLIDINPDKKGWILTADQKEILKDGQGTVNINLPSLFGGDKKEGGWVGAIDVYIGDDQQPQNAYLANQIDEDVSAYPNLSYLVFHGQNSLDKGFQLVSMSGMMKEFMLWVKRTRIRNDGSRQWYEIRPSDQAVVCEIDSRLHDDTCKPIEGYFSGFQGYLSVLGTKDPVRLIPSANSVFRWNGSQNRGVITLEVRFKYASIIEPTFNFRLQLNSASGLPLVKTIGLKASVSKVEHQTDQYWNYIIDYSVKVDKLCSINPSERTLRFEIEFSGEFTGLDSWSDIYYETALGLPIVGGPCCPSETKYNPDINPIHKIREILTDYTAMGKPESDINDENFRAMADRIYDEGLGISWCIQQKSCKEALEELEYHIEGGVRINRQTGLYEVILFRDDLLNLNDALHFNESNVKSFQPDIINAEDQINAVNVSFYDRENIKDSSFSLSDVGSFHTIDHENADDLKFPYFMNRRNAEMVANWKLKQLSTMAWKGTFTTGKYEARKLNKYDVILLSWKSKNIVNLPVRVMNINLGNGRDNTVTLDFVEVVPYSNISYSTINVDPNPNPILPPQPNSSIVFEMPYLEAVQRMGQTSVDTELTNNPEIGYLMAAAIKPQSNSLSALLYTDSGSNTSSFEEVGVVDYCASCSLDQDISFTDTSFAVKKMQDLSRVKVGTLVQVDQELLVYQSYDTETKVLTVKRGALDTLPRPHSKDAVFYFWDDSSGLDPTTYVDGEVVKAKILTTTPSGVEDLITSVEKSLEIQGRANRPYPGANVKINGEYYPDEIENDLVLTWVDRNRIQQTGGEILGFFESGVTLESGVTYQLILVERDENDVVLRTQNLSLGSLNTYTFATSSMDANTFSIEITLKSLRDGFESYQSFNHTVELSKFFSAPYDIQYTVSES